jgi:hypothetical protein
VQHHDRQTVHGNTAALFCDHCERSAHDEPGMSQLFHSELKIRRAESLRITAIRFVVSNIFYLAKRQYSISDALSMT